MREMSEAKIKLLIVGMLILFITIALIPKDQVYLDNAVINPENGDIAITYCQSSSNRIILELYDVTGKCLLSMRFYSGGGTANIAFDGSNINIYLLRTDCQYAYTRDGIETKCMSESKIKEAGEWVGWSSHYGSKNYSTEKYEYHYDQTPYPKSLFGSEFSLSITDKATGEETVIIMKNSD